jgi:hypothetical protein
MSYIWLQFYVSLQSGPNFSRDSFQRDSQSARISDGKSRSS